MNKILTVSVAAYQVGKYLTENLESMVLSEVIDQLEVFIIDDGGKDASLEIARSYERRFPNTFHAIHKENGGYGTTVNWSIQNATGKYFRLLDGDDWFDREGLKKLISFLAVSTSDVVVSDYYIGADKTHLKLTTHGGAEPEHEQKIRELHRIEGIGMWALNYKTEILRESKLRLPAHMLYTDQFYATVPFSVAKTISFTHFPVYCYRIGYAEQSMSRESRVKHTDNWVAICEQAISFCESMRKTNHSNYPYVLKQTARCYCGTVKTLLLNTLTKEHLKKVVTFEKATKQRANDVYEAAKKIFPVGTCIGLLRLSHYSLYWMIRFLPKRFLR